MTGETAQLQQLSDEQVKNRLKAYNQDGQLELDIETIKAHAADLVAEEAGNLFGADAAAQLAERYSGKVDSDWVQQVAEHGRRLYADKVEVPAYLATRQQFAVRVMDRLFERFAADPATLNSSIAALMRVTNIETDIMLAQVAVLESRDAADQRGRDTDQFERRVSDLVRATTQDSKSLT